MGGRVTDIEVDPRNSKVFYVATATGGIWKTVNAGTMFFPLFDKERIISLGDIAIAPSNGDIIYAGTGEEDARNSISPGGGIYKSIDAGKTWKLTGLEKTQTIARIVVDPRDPNIVYVAAMGQTWANNPERGMYKSHRRRNDVASREVHQRQNRLHRSCDGSLGQQDTLGIELGAHSRSLLP